jgi:hypothetical protein
VTVVSKALKIEAADKVRQNIELQDLGCQPAYQPWVRAARLYNDALRKASSLDDDIGQHTALNPGDIRILTIRVDQGTSKELDDAFARAYRALQPLEMLVVDVPTRLAAEGRGTTRRDLISRALFKAGFAAPMIWAGRDVLESESRALLQRLLPSSALGAGPRIIDGVDTALDVHPQQVMAIACRHKLVPQSERQLRLSVVMPVYNEKDSFGQVIEALLAKSIDGFDIEICIVESNSTDGTRADVERYADHPRVRLLFEDKPSGKGHAVRQGLNLATGDVVLIQDADLEYDLDDYETLLDPIRTGKASFVLGSRHPVGKRTWQLREFSEQRGVSHAMNVGHLFFTWLLNTTFAQNLRDPFTMYKVFRRDCINNIRFECNRFDFDYEIVEKLIRNGYPPTEIDIRYKSRSFEEGKKVRFFRDPPTWIKACLKHRFSTLFVWPGPA